MGVGSRRVCAVALTAVVLSILCVAPAAAREVYVANSEAGTVSAVDTATNRAIATISTGAGSFPFTLAISPDGKSVYVVNNASENVVAISTQTKSVVGAPMPVGVEPVGIAISPDGRRAYVANGGAGAGSVTVLDLVAGQPIGLPIPAGSQPQGLALSPNGSRLYVGDSDGSEVTVIDTGTNQAIGSIPVGDDVFGLAITPDGRSLITANSGEDSASIVDLGSNQAGPQIPIGDGPLAVAITPDGGRAYVSNSESGSVAVIDPATRGVTEFGVLSPSHIAFLPSGAQAYLALFAPGGIRPLALPGNQIGPTIQTDSGSNQLAAVPNQPPVASFATQRVRPGVPATLNAGASTDPDGTVAGFAWAFGDGGTAVAPTRTVQHTFAKPGKYTVTLTLTDNEGCSTAFVFTGQTAYCNGQPTAAQAKTVVVAFPGVRLRCPASAKPGGCKFKLRAVAVKGRGENKRVKAQSAPVRAKVKAGGSKVVSLKPSKRFRNRLASAKKILVQLTRTIDGETHTTVRKLPVTR